MYSYPSELIAKESEVLGSLPGWAVRCGVEGEPLREARAHTRL